MKNIYIIGALALAGALTSCDEFLDKKPLDSIVDKPEYWSVPQNVETQVNKFYNYYLGFGNAGSYGTYYFDFLNDDQADPNFANWKFVFVPSTDDAGNWSTPYERIRACNYVIDGVRSSSLDYSDHTYYEGIARLNRAFQYYTLVRRYGDVIWENHPLMSSTDPVLFGPRTSRDVVMDSVLADLNYAVATIGGVKSKWQWSTDMARAMLVDVALYEGTFCKYRTQEENGLAPNEERSKKYLTIAVDNATELMNAGYELEDDYGTIYHSFDLSASNEVIFCKPYSQAGGLGHSTIDYITNTTDISGMTKNAFDSFLFRNGLPVGLQTGTVDDAAVMDGDNAMLTSVLADRDKRLETLIDPALGFGLVSWKRFADCPALTASTGYIVRKYYGDNVYDAVGFAGICQIGVNRTQAPIYNYAQILLAYAEAKYELQGNLSQADLDLTVNALNARGEIQPLTVNPPHDPANTFDVDDLLWEIRRCRRCELMFDGNRYWDLIRWHQLDRLATTESNRSILMGANASNVPSDKLAGTELKDGYINVTPTSQRTWNPRYYLYPIPADQISLNPKLGQNPGWK